MSKVHASILVYGSKPPLDEHGKPCGNFPDASPFTQKLLLYLRMVGISHKYMTSKRFENNQQAPKGKIPFIKYPEALNDKLLGDSHLIIEFLQKDPRFGKQCQALDAHLSPLQHAQGHAIQMMVEERLFWATPYMRWVIKEGQEAGKTHAYFGPILATYKPERMKTFLRSFKYVSSFGPALGRHSYEEAVHLLTQPTLRHKTRQT